MSRLLISLAMLFSVALPVHADGNVVARVNGVAISSLQLDVAVTQQIANSTFHGSVPEDKHTEFQEQALQVLIVRELQYQYGVSQGLKPDKATVKIRIEEIRNKFKSHKEYKKALSDSGFTEEDIRSGIEKNLIIEDAIKKNVGEASLWNDADLKAYYDSNLGKFKQPESVRLRIISIADEKKAAEALARVRAGEGFGLVAAKMSEDNYRAAGGDIGYIHRGRIYPELEREAFKMHPDEVSGLVRAESMWFIIKVEEKKPELLVSFEEAKGKLKKELEAKRLAALLEKWNEELRAKAKIEVLFGNKESKDAHQKE